MTQVFTLLLRRSVEPDGCSCDAQLSSPRWRTLLKLLSWIRSLTATRWVSSRDTSNVTRRLSSEISFTFYNFLGKTCVSLTYDGISLTIGWWRWLTYSEKLAVWQFTELTTGRLGLRFYIFLVVDKMFLSHFFSGRQRLFHLLVFVSWIFLFNPLLISCLLLLGLLEVFCNFRSCLVVVQLLLSESFTATITTAPPSSAFVIIISLRSLIFFMLILSLFVRLLYGFCFIFACSITSSLWFAAIHVNAVWWFLFGVHYFFFCGLIFSSSIVSLFFSLSLKWAFSFSNL